MRHSKKQNTRQWKNNHSIDRPIGNKDWEKRIRWGATDLRRKDKVGRSTSHQWRMAKKKKRRLCLRVGWACSVFFCPQSTVAQPKSAKKRVYLSSSIPSLLIFPHGINSFSLCVCVFYGSRQASKQSQRPASSQVISQFSLFFSVSLRLFAQLYSYFFFSRFL